MLLKSLFGGKKDKAEWKGNSMLFFVKLTVMFKVENDGVRPVKRSGYRSNL